MVSARIDDVTNRLACPAAYSRPVAIRATSTKTSPRSGRGGDGFLLQPVPGVPLPRHPRWSDADNRVSGRSRPTRQIQRYLSENEVISLVRAHAQGDTS